MIIGPGKNGRTRRQMDSPSSPGNIRSSTTRSGCSFLIRSTAWPPWLSSVTERPLLSRYSRVKSASRSSSSTMRIRQPSLFVCSTRPSLFLISRCRPPPSRWTRPFSEPTGAYQAPYFNTRYHTETACTHQNVCTCSASGRRYRQRPVTAIIHAVQKYTGNGLFVTPRDTA